MTPQPPTQSPLPATASLALAYEKTQIANPSDPFYTPPPPTSPPAPPGTLLKLESTTNTTHYSVPPGTALSRFIYQTLPLSSPSPTPIPASAFILWPYDPLTLPNGHLPLVAWAHGTSGSHAPGAPSNAKHLTQHFMAPYPLALAGYVVVGADYAGLGVGRSADGKEEICHPYGASAAQAADVVYAVQAARAAFPVLGKQWVVVGHSQGGGVAWAVAEWMARAGEEEEAMEGYLGAIPIAPLTDCLDYEERGDRRNEIVAMYAARTAEMVYGKERTGEGFSARKEIFTEEGWRRLELELDHGVFIAVLVELLKGPGMLREGWRENETLKRFVRETKVGAREVRGPMLIVQGEEDPVIQVETTARAVEEMVRLSPGAEVKFVVFKGLGHDAVLYASQRLWLGWIGERFFGSDRRGGSGGSRGEGKEGLEKVVLGMGETPRPLNAYQREPNWVIKTVTESWEIL